MEALRGERTAIELVLGAATLAVMAAGAWVGWQEAGWWGLVVGLLVARLAVGAGHLAMTMVLGSGTGSRARSWLRPGRGSAGRP